MRWRSPAKLNLWLRVHPLSNAGLHPLDSLVVLVDWNDELDIALDDEDAFSVDGPLAEGVPDDDSNLVWRAVEVARSSSGFQERLAIRLTKQIPSGAGLGGGSSNAAATLVGFDILAHSALADELAPGLGADVPLFLGPAAQHMSGFGEQLTEAHISLDFAVAIVTPPIHLSTPEVYAMWDGMNEPTEAPMLSRHVPPSLRDMELFNDLYPAALRLAPELGDWRSELSQVWGRPVFMSGSGSTLFSYFADEDEAVAARDAAPSGWRAAVGASISMDGVHSADG